MCLMHVMCTENSQTEKLQMFAKIYPHIFQFIFNP
jgi:hypothetical protein